MKFFKFRGSLLGKCNTKTGTTFRSVERGNGAAVYIHNRPTNCQPKPYTRHRRLFIPASKLIKYRLLLAWRKTGAIIPDIQL